MTVDLGLGYGYQVMVSRYGAGRYHGDTVVHSVDMSTRGSTFHLQ